MLFYTQNMLYNTFYHVTFCYLCSMKPSVLRIFLFLLLISALGAQARVKFRTIAVDNGLSSNQVNAVYKDSRGNMWIGTASGLDRYDGYTVRSYRSNPSDSTALNDNYIQEIYEDGTGCLWIKAGDRFSVYDPHSDSFRLIKSSDFEAWGLDRMPNSIIPDGSGYWITAYGSGVVYVDNEGRAEKIKDIGGHFAGHDMTCITSVPSRGIIVAVNDTGRIFVIDSHTKKLKETIPPPPGKSNRNDKDMFVDKEGWVWIYCIDGVMVYDLVSHRWNEDFDRIVPLRNRLIRDIAQDHEGRLWVGYDNEGIDIFDKRGNRISCMHDPRDPFSLSNNSVMCIYNDDNDGMWVGTYKRGISIYNLSEFKFETTDMDDVNCMALAGNGNVLVGTDSHGLMQYNPTTQRVTSIPDPGHDAAIVCITPSARGGVWIGTYNDGLKYWDGRSFTRYNINNGLSFNSVWSLLENSDGTLYIGTLGGGLQLLDPETKQFTTYNADNSGLESDFISSMVEGRDSCLYLGTTQGLSILNKSNGTITTRLGNKAETSQFSNKNFNQLFFDSRDLLWVLTREGLNAYDIHSDSIYEVPLFRESSRIFSLGIAEDRSGSMWVSAESELIKVEVGHDNLGGYTFNPVVYNSHDGIRCGTFNQRSFLSLPDGEILVGGLYGITHIKPTEIRNNDFAPNLRFTSLTIDNKDIRVGQELDGNVILPQALPYLNKIVLKHNQTMLAVDFASDNYIHPDRTIYYYRLNGLNPDWVECPGGGHSASFGSIPPGKYTLEVKAVNNDGVASRNTISLAIEVNPPFWSTMWAKFAYVLLFILFIWLITKAIRKREHERFTERRKAEIAAKQEELNQLKFKFFTNISHDLRTPLSLILAPVESMLKDANSESDKRRLNTVRNNAQRLLYLVNQLLDFRKNEMSGLTFTPGMADLSATVRSLCESFNEEAERRAITLTFTASPEVLETSFDIDKMNKTVLNLLSNAFKYSPDGASIEVKVSREDNNAVITVADTGVGINDKDKAHIFERFYQSSSNDPSISGSGIGLSLVYEYVKLHKGVVTIEDNTPRGTIFKVTFPLSALHHESKPEQIHEADSPTQPISNKPKVLIVDDNYDMVTFLKDELANEFDITPASDGAEALDIINKNLNFDLVISDLMMPVMDGFELSRHLKSDRSTASIPLLILSAKQDVQSMVEGLTIGADDYITKPFNNNVLRLKMKKLIALRDSGMKRPLIEPQPSEVKITSLDEKLVAQAVKYVEDNIGRSDLSVEELARELGMSRVHLYKKLLSLTGKTPIEFIRVLRLKRAAQYLRESQLNVSEIAYNMGFNNPKTFSKYFREEFGISPSEYQQRQGI